MQIIFLGPPGAGKGTQASILSKKLSIPHLSTGEILREMVENKSNMGNVLKEKMSKGLLISDELINEIVNERIQMKDCKNGFILDGFPRTINQAKSLELFFNKMNKKLDFVIQIDVPEDILLKRITGREVCKNCSAVYNKFFNPMPKDGCKNCGSKDGCITRSDDSENAFKNVRLKKYYEETKPLIDYYNKTKLLHSVEGVGSAEEIARNIFKFIQTIR